MALTAEIIERYARIEREADVFGRVIGVKKLKLSEQTRLSEMTPGLEGRMTVSIKAPKELPDGTPDPSGEVVDREVQIERRTYMTIAAAVREVDGVHIPFPRTRGELDSIADSLDEEGIAAAMVAYVRLQPKLAVGEEPVGKIDAAKK